MIDINTLNIGDVCPCGIGLVSAVQRGGVGAGFICRGSFGGSTVRTTHQVLPGGGYTNLTNVSVTPPSPVRARLTMGDLVSRANARAESEQTSPRYPHRCPVCSGAMYRGFTVIEHAATGSARCP